MWYYIYVRKRKREKRRRKAMELRLGKRIGINALGRDIRRTYSNVVFFHAGGRNIAAVMLRRQNPAYVSFKEERNRPLWKQSMDLQMGRIPQTTVAQWSAPLRIVPIEDDETDGILFEVWQEEM